MKCFQALVAMVCSSLLLILLYSTLLSIPSHHMISRGDVLLNPGAHDNIPQDPSAHGNILQDPSAHDNVPQDPRSHDSIPKDPRTHVNVLQDRRAHVNITPDPRPHDNRNTEPSLKYVLPTLQLTIHNVSVFLRNAIPQNGAYWNRLLYSILREMENGNDKLPKRHRWTECRENDQDFLRMNMHDFSSYQEAHQNFVKSMECRHPPIIIDQPDKCRPNKGEEDGWPILLFAIKSMPGNFERRQAVRETWGREQIYDRRFRIHTVFLLGTSTQQDPDLSQLLAFEAKYYRDLLQWDFHDTLFNLTLKEHAFYSWSLVHCPHVSYVFKGDDDIFVNTNQVLSYLLSLQSSKAARIYVGHVISAATPLRDQKSKYYIPLTFYDGPYPAYAGGGGYLFPGPLLQPLYYISNLLPFFPIDDVYTGICFHALGITPDVHKGFHTFDIRVEDHENFCVYKHLVLIHQRNPRQVKRLWAGIHSPLLTC